MENKNNIIKELKELAPYLATLDRKNPFHVPSEYFFDNRNAWEFATDKNDVLPVSFTDTRAFLVPDNYFLNLPNRIWEFIQTLEIDAPLLAVLQHKINPFRVPDEYFESLYDDIKATIQVEEELLQHESKAFQVPDQYFENFADRVMARIKSEEEESIDEEVQLSPLLASLRNSNPFRVPAQYFQSNEIKVASVVTGNRALEEAEVAPQQKRGRVVRMMRTVTAVAALLAVFFIGKNMVDSTSVLPILSNGSIAGIDFKIEKELAALSDSDFNRLLNETTIEMDNESLIEYIDVNKGLDFSTINDGVIDQYLLQELDDDMLDDLLLL